MNRQEWLEELHVRRQWMESTLHRTLSCLLVDSIESIEAMRGEMDAVYTKIYRYLDHELKLAETTVAETADRMEMDEKEMEQIQLQLQKLEATIQQALMSIFGPSSPSV